MEPTMTSFEASGIAAPLQRTLPQAELLDPSAKRRVGPQEQVVRVTLRKVRQPLSARGVIQRVVPEGASVSSQVSTTATCSSGSNSLNVTPQLTMRTRLVARHSEDSVLTQLARAAGDVSTVTARERQRRLLQLTESCGPDQQEIFKNSTAAMPSVVAPCAQNSPRRCAYIPPPPGCRNPSGSSAQLSPRLGHTETRPQTARSCCVLPTNPSLAAEIAGSMGRPRATNDPFRRLSAIAQKAHADLLMRLTSEE
mmetsp:Transcript_20045/g.46101  ORF Transcript_20045/g.46101 Transcript_20045/m.46101 type:complete len:253 (-) Transcript_20045:31-789(-)